MVVWEGVAGTEVLALLSRILNSQSSLFKNLVFLPLFVVPDRDIRSFSSVRKFLKWGVLQTCKTGRFHAYSYKIRRMVGRIIGILVVQLIIIFTGNISKHIVNLNFNLTELTLIYFCRPQSLFAKSRMCISVQTEESSRHPSCSSILAFLFFGVPMEWESCFI